jgi:cytochrome bd-type quinol oxidase subunit 2
MPDNLSSNTRHVNQGFGRVLIVIYAIFAIAATARSAVQLSTQFSQAPVAYVLSALAAVIYIVATIALARGEGVSRRVATVAIAIELAGVLIVGTLSLILPTAFPHASVWSGFGSGYGFIPLILPIVGLWWLRRTRP